MRRLLHGYKDVQVCDLLRFDLPIWYISEPIKKNKKLNVKNHKGAVELPNEIEKYLLKEEQFGAIMLTFKSNLFQEH